MLRTLYSYLPDFFKGIWRGQKLEKYLSYANLNIGFMYEISSMLRFLSGKESYSQCGQDYFLFQMIFHGKKSGFFLDIGGNDPINMNNTYMFELGGWNGLAFEPQNRLVSRWKDQRNVECINIALGDKDKDIYFREEGTLSRVVKSKNVATRKVKQRALKNVLAERGIKKIDFISMDVEGYELSVLKGIDFRSVEIDVILLEVEDAKIRRAKKVRDYLKSQNYIMLTRLNQDDIWARKEFLRKREIK